MSGLLTATPPVRPPSRQKRLRQIAGALARHGLGWLVLDLGLGRFVPFHRGVLRHEAREAPYTRPEHLRLALEDLGVTAVKLGQVLSTRPDLVPFDLAAELSRLQDHAPLVPFEAVRAVVEAELGEPLDALFADFDPEPLAAASIGQVHAATLPDGTAVVVKVQRPGVEAQAEADLVLLGDLARAAASRTRWGRDYDVQGWVREFGFTLRAELDYAAEARHAEQVRRDFADEPMLHVPTIFPERSARRVLTMERLDGIKVDAAAALDAAEVDRRELARTATRVMLAMVLRNGFYHADPHPGNVLVLPGGRIGLLDFGMVGALDAATRQALLRIVLALAAEDTDRLVDELTALGVTGDAVARGPLKQDLERLRRRYATRPLKEIAAAEAFQEIMDVARGHRLRLPAELVQLAKVTAMAEGTALRLDPDFELPYVRRFWLRTLSPRAQARRLSGSLADLADLGETLPRQLRRLSRRLEEGALPLAVTTDPSPATLRRLDRAANRVAASVLAAAFVIGGSLLALAYHPTGGHPAFVAVAVLAAVLVLGLAWALWRRGRL
jgi:ubiquinone biosynthesis protein